MTDEQIKEVFRESQMYREIDKYFADGSMPEFEDDFVSLVHKCFAIQSQSHPKEKCHEENHY